MRWQKHQAALKTTPFVGRNYGYAKFASRESAQQAITSLHGQQICGMRLKVLEAEPPRHDDESGSMKRPRT